MFCRYCGNKIADDSVFCSKCGKKVKEENADHDSIGENAADGNEAVDEQEDAPEEDCPDSDSPARNDVADEKGKDRQDGASKEGGAKPALDSPAKDAAAGEDSANEQHGETEKEAAKENANEASSEAAKGTVDSVSSSIENTNPLCLVGLVLTFLMFFFNYYCIVGFAAFVFSLLGYREAKKNGQKGAVLAIVCMVVAGTASLIFFGYFIEYKRYESAVYGGLNGILDLLGL